MLGFSFFSSFVSVLSLPSCFIFAVALSSLGDQAFLLLISFLFCFFVRWKIPDFSFQAVVFLRFDSPSGRLAIFIKLNFVPFFLVYPFVVSLLHTLRISAKQFTIFDSIIYTTHKRFLKTKKLVVTSRDSSSGGHTGAQYTQYICSNNFRTYPPRLDAICNPSARYQVLVPDRFK